MPSPPGICRGDLAGKGFATPNAPTQGRGANKWPCRLSARRAWWNLVPSADRDRPALNSDAKRLHAAIRLVVSTMWFETTDDDLPSAQAFPPAAAPLASEASSDWSGGVMLHSLSVAPMPVPTGFRVPATHRRRPYASRAIEKTRGFCPSRPDASTRNRLTTMKCDRAGGFPQAEGFPGAARRGACSAAAGHPTRRAGETRG